MSQGMKRLAIWSGAVISLISGALGIFVFITGYQSLDMLFAASGSQQPLATRESTVRENDLGEYRVFRRSVATRNLEVSQRSLRPLLLALGTPPRGRAVVTTTWMLAYRPKAFWRSAALVTLSCSAGRCHETELVSVPSGYRFIDAAADQARSRFVAITHDEVIFINEGEGFYTKSKYSLDCAARPVFQRELNGGDYQILDLRFAESTDFERQRNLVHFTLIGWSCTSIRFNANAPHPFSLLSALGKEVYSRNRHDVAIYFDDAGLPYRP